MKCAGGYGRADGPAGKMTDSHSCDKRCRGSSRTHLTLLLLDVYLFGCCISNPVSLDWHMILWVRQISSGLQLPFSTPPMTLMQEVQEAGVRGLKAGMRLVNWEGFPSSWEKLDFLQGWVCKC